MRRALLATAALLLTTSFASPAAAAQPDPSLDGTCGFSTVVDPRLESSYDGKLGYLDGGPVRQNGTLTCTIKTGGPSTHAAAYEFGTTASATGTLGVTVLPAMPVAFVAHPYLAYLCTQFTDSANATWYRDGATGAWTTDPHASCDLAVSSSTTDPFLDPFFDLVQALSAYVDVVRADAEPVVCPVLAALSPGVPLVDIRPDGDTYLAGDLLLDCPPDSADPGEATGIRFLPGRWPTEAGRTAGAIRVSDTGSGPEWSVSGTLVSVDWDCALAGSGVVCDWDGYWAEPACHEANATAAALSPSTRARTRVACVRGTTVESAATGVASSGMPATYTERTTTRLPVTSLRCEVDDGTGGPPVTPFVATCGFVFGA